MATMVLRVLLALALLVTAGTHLERWFAGYRQIPTTIGEQDYLIIGPLFLANAVAGVVLAVAILAWQHWLPLVAAAAYGIATLGAFLADRLLGLFGPPSPIMWNAAEVIAAVAELACVLCAVWLLLLRRRKWMLAR